MVEWSILERAAAAFAPRGLRMETFTTAYGLAEATLAVSMGAADSAPDFIDVDPDALALGNLCEIDAGDPRARRIVSAGTALADTTVCVDETTGEIVVRSRSLASGYFDNEAATREHFRDGTFRTSDLGFVRDGQLYVSGRSDDMVIVQGRNVFVHTLEERLGAVPGIRDGNCAVVQEHKEGHRRISLVAELTHNGVDTNAMAIRLGRLTMEAEGLPVDEVVYVPPGMFPRTPSGKVQRYRCRELIRHPQLGTR